MPTNANTFNSRVTSEALEAKFRDVFPSQGGAELPQDLFASGVIQPVVDFSSIAEGSILPQNLQTAWDFSTGSASISNTTTTFINNPGFWQIGLNFQGYAANENRLALIRINDGSSTKAIWGVNSYLGSIDEADFLTSQFFVVFLRSGDSVEGLTQSIGDTLDVWYRQIADVNGTLVNPLGFTFS